MNLSEHRQFGGGLTLIPQVIGMEPAATADNERAAAGVEGLSFRDVGDDTSPAARQMHAIVNDAIWSGASDIRLETGAMGMTIKQCTNGALIAAGTIANLVLADQMIARIKLLAALNVDERTIIQDGNFTVTLSGKAVEFRATIMPSIFGEDVVLRILNKQALYEKDDSASRIEGFARLVMQMLAVLVGGVIGVIVMLMCFPPLAELVGSLL